MRPSDAARLVLLAAIWGSSFLMIKLALRALGPLQIVAGRLVIGAAVLVVLLRVTGTALPRGAGVWGALVFMAAFSNIVPFALITWGEERISSGLTSILNSTTPLFTAALAAAFLPQERPTAARWLGVGIGFSGVVVIVGAEPEAAKLVGELAVVVASLSYGIGFVFARRFLSGAAMKPLAMPAGQLLVGSVIMLPVAGWEAAVAPPDLSAMAVAAMGVLGGLGTGLAYVLFYRLIQDVGATSTSFVTYLIPIFGVAIGWLVLGERLGPNAIGGTALVIAGIALAERAARRAATENRAAEVSYAGERVDPTR